MKHILNIVQDSGLIFRGFIACRHPDHSKRPSFTKLVQSLSQPEEVLLKWASEDSNVHYQVRESHGHSFSNDSTLLEIILIDVICYR